MGERNESHRHHFLEFGFWNWCFGAQLERTRGEEPWLRRQDADFADARLT